MSTKAGSPTRAATNKLQATSSKLQGASGASSSATSSKLQATSSGSSSAKTASSSSSAISAGTQELANLLAAQATSNEQRVTSNEIAAPEVAKLSKTDITERKENLAKQTQALKDQAVKSIDYSTEKAVTALQRAEAEAQPEFQEQKNQIDIDEAKALDNQVLYSEARGDKGGIGKSQYSSIENTAAKNRLAVNAAQTKLATDTKQQIADLQAQGEYDKADKLLEISQNYLSQLTELENWAEEQNLSVDQFNAKLDQWKAEYELDAAKYKSSIDETNAELKNDAADRALSLVKALISEGITPSSDMLTAAGMTPEEYLNLRLGI